MRVTDEKGYWKSEDVIIMKTNKERFSYIFLNLKIKWNIIKQTATENNHTKINQLESTEIPITATSPNLLNDAINGKNDPLIKIFPSTPQSARIAEKENILLALLKKSL